ncbi:hypothetical protein [Niveibacterium sp.]|uniref:hypothetical protein n=1 Tax=Niveibacterium sp. TaxID=2017444 RepID=UPI0035AFA78C
MPTQAAALGVTLLIEAPIVLAATARARRGPAWRIAAALLPSCLTHPLAWHAIGNFGAHDYPTGVLLIEALVIAAEAPMLHWLAGIPWRAAFALSLLANVVSAMLGAALA